MSAEHTSFPPRSHIHRFSSRDDLSCACDYAILSECPRCFLQSVIGYPLIEFLQPHDRRPSSKGGVRSPLMSLTLKESSKLKPAVVLSEARRCRAMNNLCSQVRSLDRFANRDSLFLKSLFCLLASDQKEILRL